MARPRPNARLTRRRCCCPLTPGRCPRPLRVADQRCWAELIDKPAEVALIPGIGFGIHGDRGLGHDLLQHPDAAAGADRQGNGIAGSGVHIDAVLRCFCLVLITVGIVVAEFQHRAEGVLFDRVNDHPFEGQVASHQQGRHQVMAEGRGESLPCSPAMML